MESGSSHKMKFPEGFYGLLHVISSCGVYHPAIWKVDQSGSSHKMKFPEAIQLDVDEENLPALRLPLDLDGWGP